MVNSIYPEAMTDGCETSDPGRSYLAVEINPVEKTDRSNHKHQ